MEDIRPYRIDLDDTLRDEDDFRSDWEAAKDDEPALEIPRD